MAKLKKVKKSYKAPVTYAEYGGSPVMSIPLVEGSTFKFTFGLTKARLILEYLDEIKEFVKKCEK